jgi:hypothetical protein
MVSDLLFYALGRCSESCGCASCCIMCGKRSHHRVSENTEACQAISQALPRPILRHLKLASVPPPIAPARCRQEIFAFD